MMDLLFDIETDGLYDDVTRCWCICIRDLAETQTRYYWMDSDLRGGGGTDCTKSGDLHDGIWLLESADRLIGHNIIGYDIPVLRRLFGFKPQGEIVDTLVLSRLFRPDREGGHGLEPWGKRLGVHKGDYSDWTGGLTAEMLTYCGNDVETNLAVYHELKSEVHGQRWGESIALEHAVATIMSEQEINGVCFDETLAQNSVNILNGMISDIDDHLLTYNIPITVKKKGTPVKKPFTATGALSVRAAKYIEGTDIRVAGPFQAIEFNSVDLNSISQQKKWLSSMGWVPTEFTPTGGAKLTEDSFESLDDTEVGALLSKRISCRHRLGQIQGWLKNIRSDGRLTASANTNGTPTGRMRHSKVVNVPAAATYPKGHTKAGELHWVADQSLEQSVFMGTEMRAMFKAKPGYVIVGHDASGLELRMLAHYMNDEEYTEVLLNGDIHSHNQELAGLYTQSGCEDIYLRFHLWSWAMLNWEVSSREENLKALDYRAKFLRENPKLNRLINRAKRTGQENADIWWDSMEGESISGEMIEDEY